ncbi:MAG: Hpt domain-containing protein [Candidatus Rokubacteria bacterium]|nr:Hpt domain-containing protein [Candidatus Rokubacteria bacterium]
MLATFRVEAEEHLQAITTNLLALDRGLPPAETREVVEATFREVHTLKGAARSVSLMEVEALCQAVKSVLSRITRGDVPLNQRTRPWGVGLRHVPLYDRAGVEVRARLRH